MFLARSACTQSILLGKFLTVLVAVCHLRFQKLRKVFQAVYPRCLAIIINTPRPRQNGRHFPDEILKCIFLNENISISIYTSLKFVPKGRINNIPALVQIMAWRRSGDKPLSQPMMIILLTHICGTWPQRVNDVSSLGVVIRGQLDTGLSLTCSGFSLRLAIISDASICSNTYAHGIAGHGVNTSPSCAFLWLVQWLCDQAW